MKVALAQINAHLGNFVVNRDKILARAQQAHAQGCDVVVFPEAALFGYHPCDLLERPSVVEAQLRELKALHKLIPRGVVVLVGAIVKNPKSTGKPYLNAAVWLERGRPRRIFAKELLPTYDVFDEARHIEPGRVRDNLVRHRGKRILVTVCEDIWAWPRKNVPRYASYDHNPLQDVRGKVDLVINLSASPYAKTKMAKRRMVTKATAKHFRAPLVYVNLVGAQDELIFDGGSFVIDSSGRMLLQTKRFEEDFQTFDLQEKNTPSGEIKEDDGQAHRQALVLGLRDFAMKNGFTKSHLGLSGGIDSALVACLAVEALGAENVTCFGLPGPFSAPESLGWARELSLNLGCRWFEVPITDSYQLLLKNLEASLGQREFGVMNENLQARLRALVLMAYSNREKSLLLATSNKSELATGYSTLYGDMCGALMPIGDLLKHEVYELAGLYNRKQAVIPSGIMDRPPSAELRPNQRDEDSLPPYSELDPAVEKLVEGGNAPRGPVEQRVLNLLMTSEFKRWQAPPVLKVSDHAFGRGRRLPLAHAARF